MSHARVPVREAGVFEGFSIAGLVEFWARRTPTGVAMVAPGRVLLTYEELWQQVETVMRALRARGVKRQDRVALVLPQGPEMAAAFVAIAASATAAPLNPAYRAGELEFYLADLGAKALLIEQGTDSAARAVAQARGIAVIELVSTPEAAAGIFNLAGGEAGHPVADGFAEAGDVALVLHTSGTTGRPKRVPLTQRNLCASAQTIAATLHLTESDRCLNVMPLFHIHGLVGGLLSSLAAGGSVVCSSGFDPENFFAWLQEFRPTWYTAVHPMHQAVLSRAGNVRGGSSLKFIRSSSTPLPARVMQQLEEIFEVPVVEAYGMTEAAHQITSNPLPPRKRKPGSVGLSAGSEVAIMDDDGNFLPPMGIGDIVIRGVSLMAGYENPPEAAPSGFVHGWFRTGDQGYLDEEGYLFITGRLKEIINRGGEKISPNEIEQALLDHPDICQAAVFAAAHPSLGEDVAAAVVLREGSGLVESTIREYLRGRLADFKVPAKVWIVDEIPQGSTGKIQRSALAAKFTEQLKKDFVLPRTQLEAIIAAIYAKVLGLERVGADGNFFVLGGDSLRAMQVMSRIRTAFHVNLTIATLFRNVVVADLAEEIARSVENEDPDVMAEVLSEVSGLSDEAAEELLAVEVDPDQRTQ